MCQGTILLPYPCKQCCPPVIPIANQLHSCRPLMLNKVGQSTNRDKVGLCLFGMKFTAIETKTNHSRCDGVWRHPSCHLTHESSAVLQWFQQLTALLQIFDAKQHRTINQQRWSWGLLVWYEIHILVWLGSMKSWIIGMKSWIFGMHYQLGGSPSNETLFPSMEYQWFGKWLTFSIYIEMNIYQSLLKSSILCITKYWQLMECLEIFCINHSVKCCI